MAVKKFAICNECFFYKQAPEICRECHDGSQFEPADMGEEELDEDLQEKLGDFARERDEQ